MEKAKIISNTTAPAPWELEVKGLAADEAGKIKGRVNDLARFGIATATFNVAQIEAIHQGLGKQAQALSLGNLSKRAAAAEKVLAAEFARALRSVDMTELRNLAEIRLAGKDENSLPSISFRSYTLKGHPFNYGVSLSVVDTRKAKPAEKE